MKPSTSLQVESAEITAKLIEYFKIKEMLKKDCEPENKSLNCIIYDSCLMIEKYDNAIEILKQKGL